MEISYRRRFQQSYMIMEGGRGPEEPYELTMVAYNRIPGLLGMETEISDGQVRFWYDITGKQNLADYLGRREADGQLLTLLFQGLDTVCQQLQEYMLDESQLILDPEYLYLDLSGRTVGVAYLPGYHKDIRDSFQELMELLLRRLEHSDKQGAAMAYEMYQFSLQREMSFSDMIRQAARQEMVEGTCEEGEDSRDGKWKERQKLQKGDPEVNRELQRGYAGAAGNFPVQRADVMGESQRQYAERAETAQKYSEGAVGNAGENFVKKSEKSRKQFRPVMVHSPAPGREEVGHFAKIKAYLEGKGLKSDRKEAWKSSWKDAEEELPYVTAEEETVTYPTEVLCGGGGAQGILKYQGSGAQQDIAIEKDSFILGKEAGEVDGCITGKSVSRIHARISREDGSYYLEDMNSTNGTYLNGEQLEYRQKEKLTARDRVMFGMEEFIFM